MDRDSIAERRIRRERRIDEYLDALRRRNELQAAGAGIMGNGKNGGGGGGNGGAKDRDDKLIKGSLLFLGSVAASAWMFRKYWPKGIPYGEKEDWEKREDEGKKKRWKIFTRGRDADGKKKKDKLDVENDEFAWAKEDGAEDDGPKAGIGPDAGPTGQADAKRKAGAMAFYKSALEREGKDGGPQIVRFRDGDNEWCVIEEYVYMRSRSRSRSRSAGPPAAAGERRRSRSVESRLRYRSEEMTTNNGGNALPAPKARPMLEWKAAPAAMADDRGRAKQRSRLLRGDDPNRPKEKVTSSSSSASHEYRAASREREYYATRTRGGPPAPRGAMVMIRDPVSGHEGGTREATVAARYVRRRSSSAGPDGEYEKVDRGGAAAAWYVRNSGGGGSSSGRDAQADDDEDDSGNAKASSWVAPPPTPYVRPSVVKARFPTASGGQYPTFKSDFKLAAPPSQKAISAASGPTAKAGGGGGGNYYYAYDDDRSTAMSHEVRYA